MTASARSSTTSSGLRFDSLWLSERIGGESPDPVVGMAYAAGRTKKLKFGASVHGAAGAQPGARRQVDGQPRPDVGRPRCSPRSASASPTRTSSRRSAIERGERAAWFDEALPLMRRLWTEDAVDHDGALFHLEGIGVLPKPVQKPLDVWMGGHRAVRAAAHRPAVRRLAAVVHRARRGRGGEGRRRAKPPTKHEREIDPEHFGALIAYAVGEVPDTLLALLARRRPDLDPTEIVPNGMAELRDRINAFCDVGFSKFVVLPVGEPDDWSTHLEEVAAEILPLQRATIERQSDACRAGAQTVRVRRRSAR